MKFTLTEILVNYVKELRKVNKITTTAFAQAIGKSKSYMTKFDNCEFKTLTLEDFDLIFQVLSDNNNDKAEILKDNYFLIIYNEEYLLQDNNLYIDFNNYDFIIKKRKVPETLIDAFNKLINKRKINIDDIINYANENYCVKDYSNFEQIDFNEYVQIPVSSKSDEQEKIYIKIKLDSNKIKQIFSKQIMESNYCDILAVVNAFYLMDIQQQNFDTKLTKEDLALISAFNFLFNFGFYSLSDTKKIEDKKESINKVNKNLTEISNLMGSTLVSFIDLVAKIYNQNPFYIEDKIKSLDKNLSADAGFYIATMDLPLYKTKDLNIDTKKKLLKEISEIIERYASDEEYQEQIELI